MLHYLILTKAKDEIEPVAELKFFEWLKHLKKRGTVKEYWALKDKPGLAAHVCLNFESDLDDLIEEWGGRVPSEFTIERLKSLKSLETELARKMLG